MSSGRDVIVVPGFYDNRHPFTRKEFQEARDRAETRVNNPTESENQPAIETQAETNQANLVTDEGVIPVININELPITNEPAINATLLPDEDIESIPPTAVTMLTEANNNGEPKTKEPELILNSITPENLFDIQIKQIDMDLARYDKDQTIKGNSVRAINGRNLDQNLIVEVDQELVDRDRDFEEVNTANGIDANGRLGAILLDNIIASMWQDH
nr:hypothetical protein CFP56_73077 [Quercus suber]